MNHLTQKVATAKNKEAGTLEKKLEVNLTQNGLPHFGYLSCRVYTTSHFYHSVGLNTSNMT